MILILIFLYIFIKSILLTAYFILNRINNMIIKLSSNKLLTFYFIHRDLLSKVTFKRFILFVNKIK